MVDRLPDEVHEAIAVDKPSEAHLRNVAYPKNDKRLRFAKLDQKDRSAVLKAKGKAKGVTTDFILDSVATAMEDRDGTAAGIRKFFAGLLRFKWFIHSLDVSGRIAASKEMADEASISMASPRSRR